METLITIVNILAIFVLAVYVIETTRRGEKERYREFIKSVLAENAEEYVNQIDEDGPLPEPMEDFQELDNVDEKMLIKKLQEEIQEKQNAD